MKSALGTWGLALRIFQSTLIMIVMSFILFATNTFTMKTTWLNILLSALVILLYLMKAYTAAYRGGENAVTEGTGGKPYLRKGLVAGAIVYIPPAAFLFCIGMFPQILQPWAWFKLYMVAYQGVFYLLHDAFYAKLVSLLLMPLAAGIGYRNGIRRFDLFGILHQRLEKLVYQEDKKG